MQTDNNDQQLNESRQIWDNYAPNFDDEPDHGLRDPTVLAAWTTLLKASLPISHATVLDIGCGTGSISVLLARLGYDVVGIDFSPAMIALAKEKAILSEHTIAFHVMDASQPQFPPQQFDVIMCRHVLWALPDVSQVLQNWVDLLKLNGQLLLIEGFWMTGAGLHAQDIVDSMPKSVVDISVQQLSDQSALWGKDVTDERYIIVGKRIK